MQTIPIFYYFWIYFITFKLFIYQKRQTYQFIYFLYILVYDLFQICSSYFNILISQSEFQIVPMKENVISKTMVHEKNDSNLNNQIVMAVTYNIKNKGDDVHASVHNNNDLHYAKQIQNQQKPLGNRYWGKVKPFFFDKMTNIPRIIMAPGLVKSLFVNLFLIIVVCLYLPISTNYRLFPMDMGMSIYQSSIPSQNKNVQYGKIGYQFIKYIGFSSINSKKCLIFIYSAVWTVYQLIFFISLLLGNPGYGESQEQKLLTKQQRIKLQTRRASLNLRGYNRCKICQSIVDNSVYHCDICDLCCQGFSHHCQWVGKCIGYKNSIYLKAYTIGFPIGLLGLVLLILIQSCQ